jgi:hypothetical protein
MAGIGHRTSKEGSTDQCMMRRIITEDLASKQSLHLLFRRASHHHQFVPVSLMARMTLMTDSYCHLDVYRE